MKSSKKRLVRIGSPAPLGLPLQVLTEATELEDVFPDFKWETVEGQHCPGRDLHGVRFVLSLRGLLESHDALGKIVRRCKIADLEMRTWRDKIIKDRGFVW